MISFSGSCTLRRNHGNKNKHDNIDATIEDFENRFRCLQNGMFRELVTSRVDTSSFLNTITFLPEKLKKEYKEAIVDMLPTLTHQESINQLFYHLNFLISFIDYGLLEYIIEIFGSKHLKADMMSYVSDIQMFMEQTTIQQLIKGSYLTGQHEPPPNFAILMAKIGKDAGKCTLQRLDKLRRRLCAKVKLSHIIFHLIALEDSSSFIVLFLVPSTLVPDIMMSAKKVSDRFFQREKIVSISIGNRWLYNPKLISFSTELKQQYKKYKLSTSHFLSPTQKVFRLRLMQSRSEQCGRRPVRSKVDYTSDAEIEIEIKDVFKSTQLGSVVVLIEGASGSGKSSLAVHSCQKWSKGELFEEFTLVILVQLGDPAVQRAQSISDLLPCQDIAVTQKLAAELEATKGHGVLWILDGWDELTPQLQQDSIFRQLLPPKPDDIHRPFAPQTGESQSPILHTPHYSLGILCESSFIITSRPISSGDLHPVVSSRIELVGLSSEEQRQYFTECLEGDTEALEDLLEKIKDNPIVQSSCYIPLNAALTLHYFKFKGHTLPNTEYEIFATVIFSCIKHHLEQEDKGHDLPVELTSLGDLLSSKAVGEHFKRLCELAYNDVTQHKVTFSPSDLPQGSNTLGLLHQIDSFLEGGESLFYRFLHHSLLEVLAAMHIATCLSDSEQASQFQQLFDQPHFVSVFRFYSAITKLKTLGIDEVVKKIASDYSKPKLVQLLRCLYEAQDKSLYHFVAEQNRRLSLSYTSLSPLDCLSIGYFISLSSSDVGREAYLSNCQIGDSGVKYLTKFMCESSSPISHTQKTSPTRTSSPGLKLYLSFNGIHEDGAASIAKVLQSDSSVITLLDLYRNPIGGRGLQFIAKALITNTSLVKLDLSDCSLVISEENGPVVTEMLNKNKTLKTLDLSNNKSIMLSQTSLSYIAEGLIINTALVELDLSRCSLVISEVNGPVVTEMLIKNKTLKTLDLSNNEGIMISQTSLSYIAEGLIINTALVKLDLSHCSLVISEENGPVVTEMLIKNKTLKTLNLSNYIGEGMISDTGLSYIAEGLKRNSALEKLEMNNVTAQGGKSLATAIATNTSIALVKLDINDIEITEDSGPAFVDMLQQNITLEHISFNSSRRLSDVGVSFIAEGLKKNNKVKSLSLSCSNITSNGAKFLAKMLKVNSSLTVLNINWNPIRDKGVAYLAEALKMNKTLTDLCVGCCEITDAGVSSLTDSLRINSSLWFLYLLDNIALTKKGVKPLLDVASRKSVIVDVDYDLPQRSSSQKKFRYTGFEGKSKKLMSLSSIVVYIIVNTPQAGMHGV